MEAKARLPKLASLEKVREAMLGKKILVIGDVVLDNFVEATCERINPESPTLLVRIDPNANKSNLRVGCAGNVAMNIKALGGQPYLISVVGSDLNGRKIKDELKANEIPNSVFLSILRASIEKQRYIVCGQTVIRIDKEKITEANNEEMSLIKSAFNRHVEDTDTVLMSDYYKGSLSELLIRHIIDKCNESGIPVLVDSKRANCTVFTNADAMLPNEKEIAILADRLLGMELADNNIELIGRKIMSSLHLKMLLVSRGEKGISVFFHHNFPDYKGNEIHIVHLPSYKRQVYDTTGAGDTVAAVVALGMAAKLPITDCATLANYVAGMTVSQVGTATFSFEEIIESIRT